MWHGTRSGLLYLLEEQMEIPGHEGHVITKYLHFIKENLPQPISLYIYWCENCKGAVGTKIINYVNIDKELKIRKACKNGGSK